MRSLAAPPERFAVSQPGVDYARVLRRIRTLERALRLSLARAHRGAEVWLTADRARSYMEARLQQLRDALRAILTDAAGAAWGEGWRTADRRIRQDRERFDQRQPDTGEPPAIPPEWAAWYGDTVDQALHRYTDRIRRDVADLTTRAAMEGWTGARLTAEVRSVVQGLTTWQAERIARTETMRMWNLGSYGRMEGEGEELVGYAYSVVLDSRTSHICSPLHGLRVRREALRYIPPLHPHCRTLLEPVYSWETDGQTAWADPEAPRGVRGFGAVPKLPGSLMRRPAAALPPPSGPPAAPPPPPGSPPVPPTPPTGGSGGGGTPPAPPARSSAGGGLPINRQWREAVRRARAGEMERLAARRGMTRTEYQRRVEADLRTALSQMHLFRRVDTSDLGAVLSDGRFKTLFETGTSGGLADPAARQRTEQSLFGIAPDADVAGRPIYGYMHPSEDGISMGWDELRQYGDAAVRIRARRRRQATVTVGDSLDETEQGWLPVLAPSALSSPSWTSVSTKSGDIIGLRGADDLLSRVRSAGPVYIEAQVHGGVSIADIEEVVFLREPPNPDLQALLRIRGVRWRMARQGRN